ncbi:MAG: hypothetical protein ACRDNZ_23010 [Streptosporangiaceae bacterium]
MTPAILFSQMEPPAEVTGEFRDWYENDHIPARMALPGFQGARRFRAIDGEPAYLAIYDLDDLDALQTDGYLRLKAAPSALTDQMLGLVRGFTRFTCEQIADIGAPAYGDCLSAVAFAVPDEFTAQFDHWYEDEHVPMLLEAGGWLRVRRFRVLDGTGGPWTHLALHELASADVMDSPERARARQGPLRDALAGNDWFARSGRWLYEQVSAVVATGAGA